MSNPRIGDDILQEFGAATVSFSQLEELLIRYTAKLVNPRDFGLGIATLAGLDVRSITDIFERLLLERLSWRYMIVRSPRNPSATSAKEIKDGLHALVAEINSVRDSRNSIIHGYWEPSYTYDAATNDFVQLQDSVEQTRYKKHRTRFTCTERYTLAEIRKVTEQIEDVIHQLNDYVTWVNTLAPIFPDEEE